MRYIVKIVGQAQCSRLYNALNKEGYRWTSGHAANRPPIFLAPETMTEKRVINGVPLKKDFLGLRCVNSATKELSLFPIEVFSDAEKESLVNEAVDADAFISLVNQNFCKIGGV